MGEPNERSKGSQGMNDDERFEQVCNPILTRIESTLSEIHKAIFVGNGTPAITTRLTAGDEKMKQFEKYFGWIGKWIASMSIVVGGAIIIAIIKHFVQ